MAPPRPTTDGFLLQRTAEEDDRAFEELVRRYEGRFFRVALRILGNDGDAEDAVQLAFLRVYRKAGDYRPAWAGSTWLYRVLTNVCVDQWRKRGREPGIDPSREVEAAPSEARAISDRLDVEAALAALPPETRSVVVLRYSEDLSYEAIAQVRGVTVNTVKTQLARAKRALRTRLKGAS